MSKGLILRGSEPEHVPLEAIVGLIGFFGLPIGIDWVWAI